MMNQIVCVGRLTKEIEKEGNMAILSIAIPRSYKNAEGEYETDFVDFVLWNGISSNTAEYCHTGDIVGVKGRVQTTTYETEDGTKHKKTELIAERLTFLKSKSNEEE